MTWSADAPALALRCCAGFPIALDTPSVSDDIRTDGRSGDRVPEPDRQSPPTHGATVNRPTA
ncbi:hypothetical protein ABZT45_42595 [Streptomyces sp. NPDC005356]|uniref:hypothetical protein n=1 Tax=Streptomyces sp. NPDC005356 TaxID=3157167 RepID=UPI0033B510B1